MLLLLIVKPLEMSDQSLFLPVGLKRLSAIMFLFRLLFIVPIIICHAKGRDILVRTVPELVNVIPFLFNRYLFSLRSVIKHSGLLLLQMLFDQRVKVIKV